jgi:hypothetical protein
MIGQMLAGSSWLSGRDVSFLTSLADSPRLSPAQEAAVRGMYERWQRNQGPTFFRT